LKELSTKLILLFTSTDNLFLQLSLIKLEAFNKLDEAELDALLLSEIEAGVTVLSESGDEISLQES
jgi:hypothetical protein